VIPRNKVEKKNQGMLYFEFQLLRNLDHPHILRIYDLYKDQRYIYMITEYCEGGDIFAMIQKADNFNEKIASRIMKQVMNAVLYCHQNGIVHRDIKSDNIMFLENSIDSPIKLIDFGISLKFEKNTKLKDKTGTVLYIAPEVLQGSYDEKCDIWSCGVLMYMMLSGVPPFYGATRKEVMQKISKGKFSFKSKVWSIISKEAKELIEKMLTLNPEKRPSAREVLNHPWFIKDQNVKINTAQYLENMTRYEVSRPLR
jgi:calcium-dependent protein kinase